MNTYVIMKGSLFVGKPGRKKAYTNKLEYAQKFNTKEAAQKECCGNERVVSVYELSLL